MAKPTESLVERVRAALNATPEVKEKRMFGSVGFMVRGKLCVAAREQRIMCRLDPEMVRMELERQTCRPVVMRGREMKGYVYVDQEELRTPSQLMRWMRAALTWNETLDH